jgi:hypothetical protein
MWVFVKLQSVSSDRWLTMYAKALRTLTKR